MLLKLFLIKAHIERGTVCLESGVWGELCSRLEVKALRAEQVRHCARSGLGSRAREHSMKITLLG